MLMNGAEILLLEWLFTFSTTSIAGEKATLIAYSVIDVAAAFAFVLLTIRRRAIWAAFCVLFHFGMMFAHAAMYVGFSEKWAYILFLNTMYAASLASVFMGVWTWRYERRRRLDRFVSRKLPAWTFSGVCFDRDNSDRPRG